MYRHDCNSHPIASIRPERFIPSAQPTHNRTIMYQHYYPCHPRFCPTARLQSICSTPAQSVCSCNKIISSQSSSSAHTANIMSPPILKCITKDQREKDGFKTFKEWLEHYNHEYIGHSLHKYVKNYSGKESMWRNPYQSHFDRNEANELFENFVRNNEVLKKCIQYLENKVLGCWCNSNCHGEVLIKLYNEYIEE